MSEGLAKFRIESSPLGRGSIEVNGEDVSDRVSSLQFEMRAGQPPILILHHVAASGAIEGEGILQIADSGTGQEAIERFLRNIDPGMLEVEVLNRLGLGDDSTMRIALEVLLEWVRGSN